MPWQVDRESKIRWLWCLITVCAFYVQADKYGRVHQAAPTQTSVTGIQWQCSALHKHCVRVSPRGPCALCAHAWLTARTWGLSQHDCVCVCVCVYACVCVCVYRRGSAPQEASQECAVRARDAHACGRDRHVSGVHVCTVCQNTSGLTHTHTHTHTHTDRQTQTHLHRRLLPPWSLRNASTCNARQTPTDHTPVCVYVCACVRPQVLNLEQAAKVLLKGFSPPCITSPIHMHVPLLHSLQYLSQGSKLMLSCAACRCSSNHGHTYQTPSQHFTLWWCPHKSNPRYPPVELNTIGHETLISDKPIAQELLTIKVMRVRLVACEIRALRSLNNRGI